MLLVLSRCDAVYPDANWFGLMRGLRDCKITYPNELRPNLHGIKALLSLRWVW